MEKIKVFSMFSGFGGTEFALKEANIDYEVVGFSEIDKFAIQCFNQNHGFIHNYGDCTKINPKELPDFDLLTGGFPCILPNTLITTQRGHIPIKDVVIGDVVLTHKNRWRKVIKTMNQPKDHYYNVKIQGSPNIQITRNHPFYGSKMIKIWDNKNRKSNRTFSQSEWIKTEDIRFDDFVAFGTWSDKYSSNEKNLTNEECWLIGRYVADGCCQNIKKNKFKTTWTIGKHKKDEMYKILNKYKYYTYEEKNVQRISISNNERLYNLCVECGKGAENKKIPFWIMNLPIKKLTLFMNGYMNGDGYYNEKIHKYSANSVSKVLIYQLGQIIHRIYKTPYNICYIKNEDTTIIENRIVNQKNYWQIRFDKKQNKQDNGIWLNNNLYGRFVSKEKINKQVQVYNIEVEEDHSYVANNLIIKNCQTFSVAGNQKGEQDTRGTLFYEIIRIAEIKKPKYMVLENVEGLTQSKFKHTFRKILEELYRIGYNVTYKLMNTKDYGIPQNRNRIIFVCYRNDIPMEFTWPEKEKLTLLLKDLLELKIDKKYYLNENQIKKIGSYYKDFDKLICKTITASDNFKRAKRMNFIDETITIGDFRYDEGFRPRKDGNSPTLCSTMRDNSMSGGMPIIVNENKSLMLGNLSRYKTANRSMFFGEDGINWCLTGSNDCGVIENNSIRRLTPIECFRLQGFTKDQINLDNISDNQRYKLAGNGWSINVFQKIFEEMFIHKRKGKSLLDF